MAMASPSDPQVCTGNDPARVRERPECSRLTDIGASGQAYAEQG